MTTNSFQLNLYFLVSYFFTGNFLLFCYSLDNMPNFKEMTRLSLAFSNPHALMPLTDKWWYIKTRILEILEANLCTSKFRCSATSNLVCLLEIIILEITRKIGQKNLYNNITRKHCTCTLRITSKLYFFTKNIQKQFCNQTVLLSRTWNF